MANENAPMVYQQRSMDSPPRSSGPNRRLWKPEELTMSDVSPERSDSYLAIDDRDPGAIGTQRVVTMITAVAGRWPRLDASGRLVFDGSTARGRPSVLFLPEPEFREALDEARRRHDQVMREIRVGDAFWVRGLNPEGTAWSDIIDVSAGARETAKIALYSAVAAKVHEQEAEWLDLSADERPLAPPPSGPNATPAV
jgi:hypothetical protein